MPGGRTIAMRSVVYLATGGRATFDAARAHYLRALPGVLPQDWPYHGPAAVVETTFRPDDDREIVVSLGAPRSGRGLACVGAIDLRQDDAVVVVLSEVASP